MQTQSEVNWGLKIFADTDSTCGVGPNNVAVQVGANNAGAIANAIAGRTDATGGVTNGSRTPTRRPKTRRVTYLNARDRPEPEVHPAGDRRPAELRPASGSSTADDSPGAVTAVTAAALASRPSSSASRPRPGGERCAQQDGGRGRLSARGQPPATTRDQRRGVRRRCCRPGGVAATCMFPVPEPPNTDTDRDHIGVMVNGVRSRGTRPT